MPKVESALRKNLLREMRGLGFMAFAVETFSVAVGIPDMYFVGHNKSGWIELKQVTVSARPRLYLPVPLFKAEQRVILQEIARHGGLTYVVIQVKWNYEGAPGPKGVTDCYLCDGREAALHLGVDWTPEQVVVHANTMGQRRYSRAEIPAILRGASQSRSDVLSSMGVRADTIREVRESVGDIPGVRLK